MANAKNCGVYLIVGWSTGAHYVGASVYVRERWSYHLNAFRKGTHPYMDAFAKSYADGSLTFTVLQRLPNTTSRMKRSKHEQEWANLFPHRVNIFKQVTGSGFKRSQEVRERIRISAMGNKRWLGRKHSQQTKLKQRASGIEAWITRRKNSTQVRDAFGHFAKKVPNA